MESKFQIKPEERKSWISLMAIWAGAVICIPALMIGGLLGMSFNLPSALLCIVIGYGIVSVYKCFMGMQGCDTGLPTVSMAAGAMGTNGSKYIISSLLAIACIGWFGIQAAVCGAAFSMMMGEMTGVNIPVWISSIGWGTVMLLTAAYGYNALKFLNYITLPVLIALMAYCMFAVFTRFDAANIISGFQPPAPMPLISGISFVIATFALGGVISGDYTRYAKNRREVVISSVLGLLPAGIIVIMIGAIMTVVTGEFDISVVLSELGLPAFGLIALILAAWSTNVTNAFSGGIAVSDLFGKGEKQRAFMTIIAGGIGTLLAAFGLMNYFVDFLSILTALIPPVAGVTMAHYWVVGRGRPDKFTADTSVKVIGITAFAAGAIAAYFTGFNILTGDRFVFFVSPVNGIIVSGLIYVILHKALKK